MTAATPSSTVEPAAPARRRRRRRLAAAVEADRDEILELSHRIHANPEPAFEERQAAAWVAEALARHGYEVEHPAGTLDDRDPGDARAAVAASERSADRDPRRVRRAARPRPRLRPQHDGRVGGRRRDRPRRDRRRAAPARSCSSARPAEERGSGKASMIEDGLFDGIDAALLFHPCDRNHVECQPLASEDVDVVFHGPPGPRGVRSVEGPQRPRRDDPAVQLGRAVAAAAPARRPGPRDHPGGRHGREHHPGPDAGLVHAPQPRAGLLRGR